jgi:predicted HTH domain antitoxin
MPVTIPDHVLRQAGLTEREALIEIACRLYAAGRLEMHPASQLAGLTRLEFEAALYQRDLPVHIYTEEMIEQDIAFVRSTGA